MKVPLITLFWISVKLFWILSEMENQIYKVVNIEGKGMGCVALKDIKPGTVILNEVPQYIIQKDVLIGKVIHQKS